MKLIDIIGLYFASTSEGAKKAWDTRGRGRKDQESQQLLRQKLNDIRERLKPLAMRFEEFPKETRRQISSVGHHLTFAEDMLDGKLATSAVDDPGVRLQLAEDYLNELMKTKQVSQILQ